jgi:hypothetical protein
MVQQIQEEHDAVDRLCAEADRALRENKEVWLVAKCVCALLKRVVAAGSVRRVVKGERKH